MTPPGVSQPRQPEPDPGPVAEAPEDIRRARLSDRRSWGARLPPLPEAQELRAAIAEIQAAADLMPPAGDQPDLSPSAQDPDERDALRAGAASAWAALPVLDLDPARLDAALVVTARRADPAHAAFDVLRARLSRALAERGWSRVGITSPTKGCGKSFTALNLAFSFARLPGERTLLVDLDLRQPSLARSLGVAAAPLGPWLRGAADVPLRRVALPESRIDADGMDGLAVALSGQPERDAAELLLDASARAAMADLSARFAPGVVLCDLPPVLAQDDVIAAAEMLDGVVLVASGRRTTARDIRETARRLGSGLPILCVVLNEGEGRERFDTRY